MTEASMGQEGIVPRDVATTCARRTTLVATTECSVGRVVVLYQVSAALNLPVQSGVASVRPT
jgi:hypothetical protein